MKLPLWKNPNRTRNVNAHYNDKNFCVYYDLDVQDLTDIVTKLKSGKELTAYEDNRWALYIITLCLIVLNGPKFKSKSWQVKEEMLDQMYYELIPGLLLFDPERGSSIYSYGYRIAYTSACHYFTNKKKEEEHKSQIDEHIQQEIDDYLYEFSDHKVNTNSNKDI